MLLHGKVFDVFYGYILLRSVALGHEDRAKTAFSNSVDYGVLIKDFEPTATKSKLFHGLDGVTLVTFLRHLCLRNNHTAPDEFRGIWALSRS